MANNQGTSGGAVFAAFIIGAFAGAAAALLWAPASGEETRRTLGERAREGRQRATEAARQGREFLNRQREHLADAVDRGRDAYEKARGEKESV
jgi:gas vesicle protein